MLDDIPGGQSPATLGGWIIAGCGALVIGFLKLKELWSNSKLTQASDAANTTAFDSLNAQIDKANERADRESARANRAEEALANALQQIGDFRLQIIDLKEQVRKMQVQLDQVGPRT